MEPTLDKTTGWRGSPEVWLAAARAALIEGGVEAVKIQPLASALGLSRTSFYWFFKDRRSVLEALLDDWDDTNTGALLRACNAESATVTEAVLGVIGVFQDGGGFEERLDLAVRGWAVSDPKVMARVNAADSARLAALRGVFARFGYDAASADVRARTVYLVQIGYISMQVTETMAERMARVPGYVQTYTGIAPTQAELSRFHAALDFSG